MQRSIRAFGSRKPTTKAPSSESHAVDPLLRKARRRLSLRRKPVRPGILVLRARAGPDDCFARFAVCEENRGWQREHVVPRGRDEVVVDVQLGDLDASIL